jgi:hypothetical protein
LAKAATQLGSLVKGLQDTLDDFNVNGPVDVPKQKVRQ